MPELIKKYIIFIIGGGLGALLNLAVTYFLVEILGWWYILAYCVGGAINIIFNFMFQRKITFSVKDNVGSRLIKFFIVSILIGVCLLNMVYFLTEILKIWYIFSGIIAISIMSGVNFFINKIWIFKTTE